MDEWNHLHMCTIVLCTKIKTSVKDISWVLHTIWVTKPVEQTIYLREHAAGQTQAKMKLGFWIPALVRRHISDKKKNLQNADTTDKKRIQIKYLLHQQSMNVSTLCPGKLKFKTHAIAESAPIETVAAVFMLQFVRFAHMNC